MCTGRVEFGNTGHFLCVFQNGVISSTTHRVATVLQVVLFYVKSSPAEQKMYVLKL